MSKFDVILKESGVDDLLKIIYVEDKKYICFTKVSNSKNSLNLVVFDGIDLWHDEQDEDSIETLKEISGIQSSEAFFLNFRKAITSGDITVGKVGSKVSMTLGSGDNNISLELFEVKAAEMKSWTQTILFRLADRCEMAEKELNKAKDQIDNLKAQKQSSGGGMNALMEFGPKSTSSSKSKPTKTGMSAINPSSRKRKAAAGVVFGDD